MNGSTVHPRACVVVNVTTSCMLAQEPDLWLLVGLFHHRPHGTGTTACQVSAEEIAR